MMKYDRWLVSSFDDNMVGALIGAGFGCLSSYVLCARGYDTPDAAKAFQDVSTLHDPFLLRDMDRAVARIRVALRDNESIAIYGDYDVDGMTSVSILYRYLLGLGAQVQYYIPDRMEEGYGLNIEALRQLYGNGVTLVITVDSGITAISEVEEAQAMGLDIIVTDHHQCRETLPPACAVINPYRADCSYPYKHLAGVGVAFKLLCALASPTPVEVILDRFGDIVALGTVADVMPLTGENRTLVRRGLALIGSSQHVGLRALVAESALGGRRMTAITLGYTLAPRVNAAGRMGKTALAVELLLTDNPARAAHLSAELCALNRYRQQVENEIFNEALTLLEGEEDAPAIVLAHENWHSGVVGIVASRLSERFKKPTYLICLENGVGKGSARGVSGIDLVATLDQAKHLLSNYGGHELAAGFSLPEDNIAAFKANIFEYLVRLFPHERQSSFTVDCVVPATLFSYANVSALQELEPFGMGNATPVFLLENVTLEQIVPVGGGRHLRLVMRAESMNFQGIFFGVDSLSLGFSEDDQVDIAFHADINQFQNRSHVQLQLCDIRLSEPARTQEAEQAALYERFCRGDALSAPEIASLAPDRAHMTAVWRYLMRTAENTPLTVRLGSLARKVSRMSGLPVSLGRLKIILDVLEEFRLLERYQVGDEVTLNPIANAPKADLSTSLILSRLTHNSETVG